MDCDICDQIIDETQSKWINKIPMYKIYLEEYKYFSDHINICVKCYRIHKKVLNDWNYSVVVKLNAIREESVAILTKLKELE